MAKKIEGWIRPAGVEVNGPGYELGSGCGWCEFNECGQPDHGDEKATLVVGHERVFTESEVKAMLMRVDKAGRKPFSAEQVQLLRAEGFEVETDVPFSDPA